ncbi:MULTISPECIES: fertility inhibition protein FinO [unclassified Serratia (in: enterobacteria)]|uniref:fertility inhibition protein FinO n=1 Tax=unclassified Serratia (in: enterobacteria) TaxID=2647522 RepID=UPI00046A86C5|nr:MULTISPECIES: fertility inhibition protein FinO [unclassified Serratia (in: enterobacteria)]
MKEQERPTLTLRRKVPSEKPATATEHNPPRADTTPVVTRKKTVVVNASGSPQPAWKVKKQAMEEQAKADRAAAKAARRAEKLRLRAEQEAQEKAARQAEKQKAVQPTFINIMPLADAVAVVHHCWPALVVDGVPQLLPIHAREMMAADIRARGLDISMKKLKRCLSAITRSEMYLQSMVEGAWRVSLAGEPVAQVSASEAEYAVKRIAQERGRNQRRQAYEERQTAAALAGG